MPRLTPVAYGKPLERKGLRCVHRSRTRFSQLQLSQPQLSQISGGGHLQVCLLVS